jgi:hypothetical protein
LENNVKTFLIAAGIFFGVILLVALCRLFPMWLPGSIVLALISWGAAVGLRGEKKPKPTLAEEIAREEAIDRRPVRADCMPPGCNDYPECNHRY